MLKRLITLLAILILFAALGVAALLTLNMRGEDPVSDAAAPNHYSAALVDRGRYLALAGNCAGCHTERGGAPYAGGVGIDTPFGTIRASNITPDKQHGIGGWNADHFWRALHNGRSRDGRLLYPAFPYPSFTRITREDSDALFAYLRTVPPSPQANAPHALRFPYNTQLALATWRALFFKPAEFAPDPQRSASWNRGAYLVQGAGHCVACHGARNSLGATIDSRGLGGAVIPGENWYAPALDDPAEAGVGHWSAEEAVALLKTGKAPHASAMGPMADVVWGSTQHLSDTDLLAIATYLRELPPSLTSGAKNPPALSRHVRDAATLARGQAIYDRQCAYCHGEQGQGQDGAFPPLRQRRAVVMTDASNLVQVVRHGGYLPTTAGNPQPAGMPPFGQVLDDADIAAVLTYVRASWGNDAPAVSLQDAMRR
ncbi:c-type cytochrome [Variovorax dokdonensis]|uniref:C-type cytochrome n=2 Tax=Variovorax dokdonensis TaxID=344883 RepID=A0ABT7N7F2_9BURK|nr:c-type cytochrome [Variovorax dokdonensis]MDM0043871.1 c-type cytochrome [Variovorax dokdonensis]